MMIIGLSAVNVAPATTGRRTPKSFDIPRAQADRRADDERDRHRAGVHDEQVLQAEDQQLVHRQDLLDGMDPRWSGWGDGGVQRHAISNDQSPSDDESSSAIWN
jgi:hypothetical protein